MYSLSKVTMNFAWSGAHLSLFVFINTWEGFKESEAFYIDFEIQQPQ